METFHNSEATGNYLTADSKLCGIENQRDNDSGENGYVQLRWSGKDPVRSLRWGGITYASEPQRRVRDFCFSLSDRTHRTCRSLDEL